MDSWIKTTCKQSAFLSPCAKRNRSISIKIHYILVDVYFKSEKVLISVLSWKIMTLCPFGASSPLFFRNGQILGLSPIRNGYLQCKCAKLEGCIHSMLSDRSCTIHDKIKLGSRYLSWVYTIKVNLVKVGQLWPRCCLHYQSCSKFLVAVSRFWREILITQLIFPG